MSKYGKHCKKDSDCPSKICEMTYFKNNKKKPDSRKCVNSSYKSLNMENNVVVIDNKKQNIFSDKPCVIDQDCPSGICEDKYTVEDGVSSKSRMCVNQKKKFGKECTSNNDCESHKCVRPNKEDEGYDPVYPLTQKCIIYDNPPDVSNPNRDFGGINESDLPEEMQDPKWKAISDETVFLPKAENAKKLQGRGPIAALIILFMEYIAVTIQVLIKIMILIWKVIFIGISVCFTYIFQFFKLFRTKCSNETFRIPPTTIAKFFAVLFPPYGVFIHLGAAAFPKILITCILTMFMYFPGVFYAWSIINSTPKPTVANTRVPALTIFTPLAVFPPFAIFEIAITAAFPKWTIDPMELYNMFFHGQLIKDDVCIPMGIVNTTVSVFMPPLGLYMKQKEIKQVNMKKIIVSLILTGIFYFPGLFYSLYEQKRLKRIHKK